MQAMINLYESYNEALHAIQELEAASIPAIEISMITLNGKRKKMDAIEEIQLETQKAEGKAVAKMPSVPDAVELAPHLKGAFFSFLDLKEMDDVGGVIAAGWLIERERKNSKSRHVDAEAVVSIMLETGVNEDHARTYIEGIRRGGTLVGVRAEDSTAEAASRILREEHQPLDPHMRGHHYWQGDVKNDTQKLDADSNRLLAALITGQS